jgi:hypothetical protein
MPELHRPQLHRPVWPLTIRQTLALAIAFSLVVAAVSAMVVVIPNKPVATPGTGSVRDIAFHAAAEPPAGHFDYGPYFVDQGARLVMIGTEVGIADNGAADAVTTVWATTDGSTWQTISAPGSFAENGGRFVVQGFADDGSGGLVAVGNATGVSSKVEAQAWHSRDGKTWTAATIDFPTNVQMIGLASRPGALVSAGNGVAWFSHDGTSWNVTPLPDATGFFPRVVRTWSGGFEILAISGGTDAPYTASWVSSDGREWIRTANMPGFQVQDLVAYGNGMVAVGSQQLTQEELATPTPTPTGTPSEAAATTTAKPTPTPKPTAAPSGSAATASPSPTPTPAPEVEIATSWISPDGSNWYRGSSLNGRGFLALESVTQVYDSLVAVGSEPEAIPGGTATASSASPTAPGATPTPERHASLWTSEDGLNWSPLANQATALSRGRLTSYGHSLVLAGFDESGTFDVLVGNVALGSPVPIVAASPTPPFTVALRPGSTPMVPNVTEESTLGPLVAAQNRFLLVVNDPAGAAVYSSPDGKAWTISADPRALTPAGSTGAPAISDAIDDGQGGVVAVGSLNGDTQTAAVWQLTGTAWTPGTITVDGTAPTSLGSVATQKGNFVAAADSEGGARILFSRDGQTWQAASISGADNYQLTVTSWSGGFLATGANSAGKGAAWSSPDGQFWISEASWKLPGNLIAVYGTRTGLIATTASVATGTSWWWSTDGREWHDSQLTTAGGCWSTFDSGLLAVSSALPGAAASGTPTPAPTPTPKPTPRPSGSIAPTPSPTIGFAGGWTIWASKDDRTWQQPGADKFGFDADTTCRIASTQGRVVIVGWADTGVPRAFSGTVNGA